MTDQLRGDALGYAGHPDVKTPYLDTLASRGVAFDRAYSACPSCIAARAALHTGMEQSHHGRVGYEDSIPWRYEHTLARPWTHEEKYPPTNWVTDRCLDFLRRRDPDQPFFLMASYLRPHPPFDAPQYYFDLYRDKDLRPPFVGTWESDEYLRREGRIFDSKTGPADKELIRQAQIGYYACITHLDHQIGRLIMALVEQEVYDDTIILFTSDHGEELCDHHMFRKSRPYEGSCRVPFFVWAGKNVHLDLKPSSVCHGVVELRDVMPTLLSAAGADIPDSVDGKDLLPLLSDPSGSVRPWLHGEHSYGDFSNHWIVTETDKYIWHSATGREQYFNLREDPHELTDLINESTAKERISFLRSCLIKSLKDRPEGFTDGIEHSCLPVLGVQFHPERLSGPGRGEGSALFQWLISCIEA